MGDPFTADGWGFTFEDRDNAEAAQRELGLPGSALKPWGDDWTVLVLPAPEEFTTTDKDDFCVVERIPARLLEVVFRHGGILSMCGQGIDALLSTGEKN